MEKWSLKNMEFFFFRIKIRKKIWTFSTIIYIYFFFFILLNFIKCYEIETENFECAIINIITIRIKVNNNLRCCVKSNYINFVFVSLNKDTKIGYPVWKFILVEIHSYYIFLDKIWWKKYENPYDTFMEKSHYFEIASVMFRDERGNRHRPKIAIFQTEDRDARKSSHVSRVSRVIMIFFSFRNRVECFTIVANRRNHVHTPYFNEKFISRMTWAFMFFKCNEKYRKRSF